MIRRALSVCLVICALPGLLVGLQPVVVHEHEDGDEPHRHATLVGHFHLHRGHSHDHSDASHEHSHDHANAHSEESQPRVDDERSPTDDERHGHYQDLREQAVRRGDAIERPVLEVSGRADACRTPVAQLGAFATEKPRPPAERAGHPPSMCARTTTRLVQGLGLLI